MPPIAGEVQIRQNFKHYYTESIEGDGEIETARCQKRTTPDLGADIFLEMRQSQFHHHPPPA
jgi:hypothetical protein